MALGSAREMLVCLELAEAFGSVRPISEAELQVYNRIIGTLVRLVERGS